MIPNRCMHLDFHNAPDIKNIGADFRGGEFAGTLKNANVQMVTFFAKCVFGLSYYPTKVGIIHPHLKIDLLGEALKACHKKNIKLNAYICVCWDNHLGREHPEYVVCMPDRKPYLPNNHPFSVVCINNNYRDILLSQTKEILDNYDIDGIFFDIVDYPDFGCYCPNCIKKMKKEGVNIDNPDKVFRHSRGLLKKFMEDTSLLIKKERPDISIFYNGMFYFGTHDKYSHFTHFEVESPKPDGWDQSHFAFWVRYARNFKKDVLDMTSRFHKKWGDYGGLKQEKQLEYECRRIMAHGAQVSIGDHLHPGVKLNKAVYNAVGNVFKRLTGIEKWCRNTESIVEAGLLILFPEKTKAKYYISDSENGAIKMLIDCNIQFDVIDEWMDFNRYKLLIIPDKGALTSKCYQKLKTFLVKGGKVIFTGTACFDKRGKTIFRESGINSIKKLDDYAYILPEKEIDKGIPEFDYILYDPAYKINSKSGVKTLACLGIPYKSEGLVPFQSITRYSPIEKKTKEPLIVQNKNVIYIATTIFNLYFTQGGYWVYRRIFENCLDRLLPSRLLETDAPDRVEITLNRQGKQIILHIINHDQKYMGDHFVNTDEEIVLHNINLSVKLNKKPNEIYIAETGRKIPFKYINKRIKFCLRKVKVHEIIVIE